MLAQYLLDGQNQFQPYSRHKAIIHTTANSSKDSICAAEAVSLALFANGCLAKEVWSTAASMAVLNNSTTQLMKDAMINIMRVV